MNPVVSAIEESLEISHTACLDEFRRNLRLTDVVFLSLKNTHER